MVSGAVLFRRKVWITPGSEKGDCQGGTCPTAKQLYRGEDTGRPTTEAPLASAAANLRLESKVAGSNPDGTKTIFLMPFF